MPRGITGTSDGGWREEEATTEPTDADRLCAGFEGVESKTRRGGGSSGGSSGV